MGQEHIRDTHREVIIFGEIAVSGSRTSIAMSWFSVDTEARCEDRRQFRMAVCLLIIAAEPCKRSLSLVLMERLIYFFLVQDGNMIWNTQFLRTSSSPRSCIEHDRGFVICIEEMQWKSTSHDVAVCVFWLQPRDDRDPSSQVAMAWSEE